MISPIFEFDYEFIQKIHLKKFVINTENWGRGACLANHFIICIPLI